MSPILAAGGDYSVPCSAWAMRENIASEAIISDSARGRKGFRIVFAPRREYYGM